MKKLITLTIVFAFVATCLVGCGFNPFGSVFNNLDKQSDKVDQFFDKVTEEVEDEMNNQINDREDELKEEVLDQMQDSYKDTVEDIFGENGVKLPETEQGQNIYFNPTNSNYTPDQLTVQPFSVYWENGKLVAKCFVVNGFSTSATSIEIKKLIISNRDGVIAEGTFGKIDGLDSLPAYSNMICTFTFENDAVKVYNADLTYLQVDFWTGCAH